jgi:hypothetical protein
MLKKPLVLIPLIIILLASAIFVKLAFSKGWFVSYLSVNKPVSPDLLIVEGWVSDTTIHLAAKEFQNGAYKGILTSGSPTDPNYLLSQNGFLEFSLIKQPVHLQKNDTVSFIIKGSPSQGVFPEYIIFINDQQVFSGFCSGIWKPCFYVMDSALKAETISILFTNDAHYMGEDRNMLVQCLDLKGVRYPARSSIVKHYNRSDLHRLFPMITSFGSVAEICAHELEKDGIPAQLIEAVPSPVSQKNRTLASALVLSDYLQNQNQPYLSLNIMSEGIHARRTWNSYKFAFKKQAIPLGIISVPSARSYGTVNTSYTNKEILRELTSIVYYRFFFNKKRYQKELIQHLPQA